MASISERGGGWRVRWRTLRGQQVQRTVPTKRLAVQLQREVEASIALGRDWRPRVARETLAALGAKWIAHRAMRRKASTVALDATRLSVFEAFLQQLGHGPDVGPEVLSRSLMDQFFDHLRSERGNSVRTAGNGLKTVLQMWRWLSDHDEFAEGVPRAPLHFDIPQPPASETAAPTWAQIDAMLEHLEPEWMHRALVIQRYTGLRIMQARRLHWEDFDLTGRDHGMPTLYVRPELAKTRSEASGRLIPITAHLVDAMSGWGVREGRIIQSTVKTRYEKTVEAWRASGAPKRVWKGHSTHATRAAFRTNLLARGVSSEAIEAYCGRELGGTRGAYTDPRCHPWAHLVEQIPRIGEAATVATWRKAGT